MTAYLKKTLILALALVSLAACQKKDDSTSVNTMGRYPRGGLNQMYANGADPRTQMAGTVKVDPSYQDQFQEAVRGLLSTALPEDYVGYVSAVGAYNTGVFFGGRVIVQRSGPQGLSGAMSVIAPNSQIMVLVKDYFQNQSSSQPIPIYLSNATGEINGNSVHLVFQDQLGTIELEGEYNQSTFEGDMYYDNYKHYSGGTPAAGVLGHFSIPTCQFFVCN